MTKERVCANGPTMSRRTILTALPASGLAQALPAATDNGHTKIMRLFNRHEAIRQVARNYIEAENYHWTDDQLERLFYRHTDRLEAEIMAEPSTCARDMAAKMILAHCDGDFSCLSRSHPVWIEARGLISI